MTAALSWLLAPLHTLVEFVHWDMFEEPAHALYLRTASKPQKRPAS